MVMISKICIECPDDLMMDRVLKGLPQEGYMLSGNRVYGMRNGKSFKGHTLLLMKDLKAYYEQDPEGFKTKYLKSFGARIYGQKE